MGLHLRGFTIAAIAALLMVALLAVDVTAEDATSEGLSVEVLAYEPSSGRVVFYGHSSEDFVTAQLTGEGYASPVTAALASDGFFSDSMYVGQLDAGTYTLSVRSGGMAVEKTMDLSDVQVQLSRVAYDPTGHTVSFIGSSNLGIVNVLVMCSGFVSPVTAVISDQGVFSGSLDAGQLEEGSYYCVAGNGSSVSVLAFEVKLDLYIEDLTFNTSEGTVSITVYSLNGDPTIRLTTPSGSSYEASPSEDGNHKYSASISIGQINDGAYTVVLSQGDQIETRSYSYPEGPVQLGDDYVVDDTGRVLIRYIGSSDTFRVPNGIDSIESGAFDNCSIKEFVLDRDLSWDTTVDETFLLENCGIEKVTILDGVTSIPDFLFGKTNITTVMIPSSVESIGQKSFYKCDLESVSFDDGTRIQEIGDYAFSYNHSLKTVTFGGSASGFTCDIGVGSFFNCRGLSEVVLDPQFGLKSIGNLAFAKVITLSDMNQYPARSDLCAVAFNKQNGIQIPAGVEEIGFLAFSTVDYRHLVDFSMTNPTEPGANTYSQQRADERNNYVHYPRPLSSEGWTIGFDSGSSLGSIGDAAFAGYSDVTSLDLSNCDLLQTIGRYAFIYTVDSSSTLVLPGKIQQIGAIAFYSDEAASADKTAVLPASLRTTESNFYGIYASVSFAEGSDLGSITTPIYADLSNCVDLEEFELSQITFGSNISEPVNDPIPLPAGVYQSKSINAVANYTMTRSGVLEFGVDTAVTSWSTLNEAKAIVVAEGNEHFVYDDDAKALYLKQGAEKRLIRVLSGVTSLSVESGSSIPSGILPGSIESIRLKGDNILEEDSLEGCSALDAIYLDDSSIDADDIRLAQGSNTNPLTLYILSSDSMDYKSFRQLGDLMIGLAVGDGVVYVEYQPDAIRSYPVTVAGSEIELQLAEGADDIDVISSGCNAYIDGSAVRIVAAESESSYVWFFERAVAGGSISVTLDYGGGADKDGLSGKVISSTAGRSLNTIDLPSLTYRLHKLSGWSLNGSLIDDTVVLESDCTLVAVWTEREPVVSVDEDSLRFISCNGSPWSGDVSVSGQQILLTATVPDGYGYQLLAWVRDGAVLKDIGIDSALDLSDVKDDVIVSVEYRYYSPSSGLMAESDRGLPSSEETGDLVYSYELGGYIDMSGMYWSGHASVPLIVDNVIYFRAGPAIYAAEADTGYIFARAPSQSPSAYYHQLGYGEGVIIDYITGKAYDLDLNQLYVLERSISGVEFYNGLFYTSGSYVYTFTPTDDDTSRSDEVKEMKYLGRIKGVFGSYGFSSSVFVGDYMYRVIVDGPYRGFAAMDLKYGEVKTKMLTPDIDYMYLDDGWISYCDGYLYLTAYSAGLFGAVASLNDSCVVYVGVDGLDFDSEIHKYTFEGNAWSSQVVFYNDVAYVASGGTLYRFDVRNGLLVQDSVKTAPVASGHGSISLDTSHWDENGDSVVYIYSIPYLSTRSASMSITEDKGGVLTTTIISGLPANYNSQAVRADLEGGMVWYNDSGHIYRYTTPEKNRYFFFIDNGSNAAWYESYGRNYTEALSALGEDVIAIDRSYNVQSMFGAAVDDTSIWVLKSTAPGKAVGEDLSEYAWTRVSDLYDRTNDDCHYIQIVAGSANAKSGDAFVYATDTGTSSYTFADNIGGGRSVVGTLLSYATNAKEVRFFDDFGKEIRGTALVGVEGAPIIGDFPDVRKDGYVAEWKDDNGNVVSDLSEARYGTVTRCTLTWAEVPETLDVVGTWSDDTITVKIESSESGSQEMTVQILVRNGDVCSIETKDVVIADGTATASFDGIAGTDAFVRVLLASDSGAYSADYGHYTISKGASE